jgi:hypothetical protein
MHNPLLKQLHLVVVCECERSYHGRSPDALPPPNYHNRKCRDYAPPMPGGAMRREDHVSGPWGAAVSSRDHPGRPHTAHAPAATAKLASDPLCDWIVVLRFASRYGIYAASLIAVWAVITLHIYCVHTIASVTARALTVRRHSCGFLTALFRTQLYGARSR